MSKRCYNKGGIKTICITDLIPTSVNITDFGYDSNKFYEFDFKNTKPSDIKTHYTQAIEITIKPDKREYWEQLGYESEQSLISNLHLISFEGDICYTHNCNPEICMKNKY